MEDRRSRIENRGLKIEDPSSILHPRSSTVYPRSSDAILMKLFLITLLLVSLSAALGQSKDQKWRPAAEKELKSLIPARVAVENERIETEVRTASGITNGNGKFIAGVVMITAGYSAEGKYSHFFITQVGIKCGDFELRPGEYVFGHKRTDQDTLKVSFYEASTGKHVGDVKAQVDPKKGPVRQITLIPPGIEKPMIKLGRFFFEYNISG
jgi:hypothetical protein